MEYFGSLDTSSVTYETYGSFIYYNNTEVLEFTCPGSGNQGIVELGLHCKYASIGNKHVKVGVYNSDGSSLLCSSAPILVNNSSLEWKSQAWSSSTPLYTLTGGVKYVLAFMVESSDILISRTGGDNYYFSYDYDGTYPDLLNSLSVDSNIVLKFAVRCGVEPVSSGGISIPVLMSSQRRRKF